MLILKLFKPGIENRVTWTTLGFKEVVARILRIRDSLVYQSWALSSYQFRAI